MWEKYVEVIVPVPLEGQLTYQLPEAFSKALPGCRVTVPLGKNRTCTALITKKHGQELPEGIEIRDILDVLDERPVIRLSQLRFWEWIASYYLCTPGEVYKAAFFKKSYHKKRINTPVESPLQPLQPLSPPQEEAFKDVCQVFLAKEVCLLYDVSSDGKTEIYIHLIHETLSQGRQVLYLLPEIAVTTSFTDRLRRIFGDRLLSWHSGRTDRQRAEVWNTLLEDDSPRVVLGVRSAIFLPFAQLGLVIVDNEHEAGYKQSDPAPRYHARSAAIMLAGMYKAKTLLCSATPSMDSYYNASTGKYGSVTLDKCDGDYFPPHIITIDIKEERRKKKMKHPLFSPLLISRIEQNLAEGEQSLLFQSRRETERTEVAIAELFPSAHIARLDPGTAPTQKLHTRIVDDFNRGEVDILINGYTSSNGLDFKRVDTIAILLADNLMNFTDFRAHERAYQAMIQMTGYGLRNDKPCTVVLQTGQPEHPLIDTIERFDYEAMAKLQLKDRYTFHYPPYCRLITIVLRSRHEDRLRRFAESYAARLRAYLGERVLGPMVPVIIRPQKMYVQHLILKVENTAATAPLRVLLVNIRHEMLADPSSGKGVSIHHDVDL